MSSLLILEGLHDRSASQETHLLTTHWCLLKFLWVVHHLHIWASRRFGGRYNNTFVLSKPGDRYKVSTYFINARGTAERKAKCAGHLAGLTSHFRMIEKSHLLNRNTFLGNWYIHSWLILLERIKRPWISGNDLRNRRWNNTLSKSPVAQIFSVCPLRFVSTTKL